MLSFQLLKANIDPSILASSVTNLQEGSEFWKAQFTPWDLA